jgi:SM-20-related protein
LFKRTIPHFDRITKKEQHVIPDVSTSVNQSNENEPKHYLSEQFAQELCTNLAQQSWSQHTLFLPHELMQALASECRQLHQSEQLKQAQVGRGEKQSQQSSIRSDKIAWIEPGQSPACDQYLELMDELRKLLNQNLYLGLEEFETHFAFYTPGAYYGKHLDRFHDDDARTVSAVIYLNEDWQEEYGGALRLHLPENTKHDISPIAGSLALFLSAEILHEVLPATRDRMSLTGWFRRRK